MSKRISYRWSYRAIGHRLRVARLTLGLTEQDVARAVCVTLRTYHKYEAGQKQRSIRVLVAFGQKYDVSLDWLILGEGACIGAHLARRSNSTIAILPVSQPRWRKHRDDGIVAVSLR
jgi:transcriptional regulator with XRE-family HTH domain